MDQAARTDGAPPLTLAEGDAAALRAQIEATRAELGDTVAALAVKADVKQQARHRVDHLKQQLTQRRDALTHRSGTTAPGSDALTSVTPARKSAATRAQEHPLPLIAAGAVAAGFAIGRLTAR